MAPLLKIHDSVPSKITILVFNFLDKVVEDCLQEC